MDFNQGVRGDVFDVQNDIVDYVDREGHWSRAQDVTEIMRMNAFERNGDKFKGFRKAPTFRKVASIPSTVIDLAKSQGVDLLNDMEALKIFLNDPSNRAWRTTNERV